MTTTSITSRSGDSHPAASATRLAGDRGSALIVVMVTMTILIALVTVGLNHAIGSTKFNDRQANWNEALAAAESGVDDYLARLNKDDSYWQTADCSNIALRGNPAVTGTRSSCSWGAGTPLGWRKVPGPLPGAGSGEAPPKGEFHYDIDVSETPIDGTITIRSTGRVEGVTRTVQSVLRRGGFGEFLYYTVYETVDPANEAVYTSASERAARALDCPRYWWATPKRGSDCSDINFVTGDVMNGPMHTNDAMLISGSPRFNGSTTTSYPSCRGATNQRYCYRSNGTTSPAFAKGIGYRAEIELPTSIGDMRQYVTPAGPGVNGVAPEYLGCLYTGPTRIIANSNGTLRIWSKWSGRPGGPALNPGCGSATDLQSTSGATVSLPHNKVIMVQNVPAAQTTPAAGACATGAIGDGLPVANDINTALSENACRNGNLYIEGVIKGRVTMVTDNNVIVTGDITYAGGENGTDVLGLIAENSVKIYHPVNSSGNNLLRNNSRPVLTNVTLSAAVLTLQHSFTVQYYQRGAKLGTLKVYGSLAQRFRGPVGTSGGSGYLKNYNYDTRLRYSPPPYFLDPVRSGWGQKVYGEVSPKY
ncbi:pilus assembly PilX family protein [Nocardioides sp. GXZ039]|uniref:pilus assembly PilX family protein n=1 Tax=Nocardioides sp. GXZ039 TaxID=3136018 RepID=UPI0030F37A3F